MRTAVIENGKVVNTTIGGPGIPSEIANKGDDYNEQTGIFSQPITPIVTNISKVDFLTAMGSANAAFHEYCDIGARKYDARALLEFLRASPDPMDKTHPAYIAGVAFLVSVGLISAPI